MTKTPQLATNRFLRCRHPLIQRPRRLDREFAVYQDLGETMWKDRTSVAGNSTECDITLVTGERHHTGS